jgi:NDP-sugar pyrophosphorylase family protein
MQLIIPAAGLGSRFKGSSYRLPKPLISVYGIPMLSLAAMNLLTEDVTNLVIVTRSEISEMPEFRKAIEIIPIPVVIKNVDYVTDGPADTVKLAAELLHTDGPVTVANCDQFIDFQVSEYYSLLQSKQLGGLILTMQDNDPKWSYVRCNDEGNVIEIKEKVVISNEATVGVYSFASREVMLSAFQEMWEAEDKTNNEYYVAPSFNYIIKNGGTVGKLSVGPISAAMYGLGIPEDLDAFTSSYRAKGAVRRLIDKYNL